MNVNFVNNVFNSSYVAGESSSVAKELEATTRTRAVYQDKTNILFSVKRNESLRTLNYLL